MVEPRFEWFLFGLDQFNIFRTYKKMFKKRIFNIDNFETDGSPYSQ